jgi:putative phosphoesterase
MRVGLISDTHVPTRVRRVPGEVLAALAGCEAILHAGDLVEVAALEDLRRLGPVFAVRGNMDRGPATELPLKRVVELGGLRIGLFHGHGRVGTLVDRVFNTLVGEGVDVMVFGHSHEPLVRRIGEVLLVNPGSATCGRGKTPRTVAILDLDGTATAEIVSIPRPPATP